MTWTVRLIFFFMVSFVFFGCAFENSDSNPPSLFNTHAAIIGGKAVEEQKSAAQFVALLLDQKKETFCTAFLIQKDILLTAAHCLSDDLADMLVAFGTQPRSGHYRLRLVKSAIRHPLYNHNIKGRHDLAVVQLSEQAPQTAKLLSLPDSSFPLLQGLKFTAFGYGQNQGTKSEAKNGELQSVVLEVSSLEKGDLFFTVSQRNGKGICHGDSGGPAIMRFQNKDFAVGIASAISWTTPKDMTDDQRQEFNAKNDLCSERSIYMNVQEYRPWLDSVLSVLGY